MAFYPLKAALPAKQGREGTALLLCNHIVTCTLYYTSV